MIEPSSILVSTPELDSRDRTPEEEAFHRTRRMFVRRNSTLIVCRPDDPRSHEQWFEDEQRGILKGVPWNELLYTCVRGFFNRKGIFLFQATPKNKWDLTPLVHEQAPSILFALGLMQSNPDLNPPLGMRKNLPVFGGMNPGAPGTLWLPMARLDLVGP